MLLKNDVTVYFFFQILLPWFLFVGSSFYYLAYHGIAFHSSPVMKTASDNSSHVDMRSRAKSLKAAQEELKPTISTKIATNESKEQIVNYQNGCSIHRHVAFLKTHKTGRLTFFHST